MKLEILRENLTDAIGSVGKVSNKNLSLPVLGCVVIVASQERTVARATNLDVSVEMVLKAKVVEEGIVAVPAAILTQAVGTATDQRLTLEGSGTTLKITGSHGTASLKTLDPSEFPTLPYVKDGEGVSLTLPTKELLRALKAVSFAASSSGMRPELASVYLSIYDSTLITAATDSFRLAEMRVPIKARGVTDPILIPARNVADILRGVTEGDTTEVRVGENQVTFIAGGNYVTSRTVEAAFPEYKAIIPTAFTASATMLLEDALHAFRKVLVFTDAYSQVEVTLKPNKKDFLIRAANAAVGETTEAIDATLEGDDLSINFNIRYIIDALSTMTADGVVFKVAGPGKPMVIEEVPSRGFTYLVMPMNK